MVPGGACMLSCVGAGDWYMGCRGGNTGRGSDWGGIAPNMGGGCGGGGIMPGTTVMGGAGCRGGYEGWVSAGCLTADDVDFVCPAGEVGWLPLPQMLDSCVSRAWRRDFMSIFTGSSSALVSAIGGGCFGDMSVGDSGMVHWGVMVTGDATRGDSG